MTVGTKQQADLTCWLVVLPSELNIIITCGYRGCCRCPLVRPHRRTIQAMAVPWGATAANAYHECSHRQWEPWTEVLERTTCHYQPLTFTGLIGLSSSFHRCSSVVLVRRPWCPAPGGTADGLHAGKASPAFLRPPASRGGHTGQPHKCTSGTRRSSLDGSLSDWRSCLQSCL